MTKQKLNIPKCPKTVSGNHRWKGAYYSTDIETGYRYATCQECVFCELIDDTYNELEDFTKINDK